MTIKKGAWLGIDIGSAQKKVCNFCLVESDGVGGTTVRFEQGPARAPYPSSNTKEALIGRPKPPWRRPTYLKKEIEREVRRILDCSELVGAWFKRSVGRPSAVAVDAPVAFATQSPSRLTEQKSTDTFKTPTRDEFEEQLKGKKDGYLRVNNFWKCIGLAVYRHLAARIDRRLSSASLKSLAALTCDRGTASRRLRETFPSDVYKRANGHVAKDRVAGILCPEARGVLKELAAAQWQAVDVAQELGHRPASQTMKSLLSVRDFLQLDLELPADRRICEMHKRSGRAGDLLDAFTCAFAVCCEDHGGAELHGWNADGAEQIRLRKEGAILTVVMAADLLHLKP